MAGIMAIMVITVMKSQNKLSGFINKKLIGFVIVAAIVLMGLAGFGNVAHAYTDEEKAQAKAWLSAHGYSPDAGGAAAAYQDYLNGKFDEELGITRENSGNKEKDEKTTEQKSTSVTDIYNTLRNEKTTREQSEESSGTGKKASGNETVTETATELTTESLTEEVTELTTEAADNENEINRSEENTSGIEEKTTDEDVTLYDVPAKEDNSDIVVYIVLAVVGLLVVGGVIFLVKK